MRSRKRFCPQFESLEDRRCFALALGFDRQGLLNSISEGASGQTAAAVMRVDDQGRLQVKEGNVDYGTHAVARSLSVQLSGQALVNRLDLDNHTLRTNLDVKLGDAAGGPAQFQILGGTGGDTGAAGRGTIAGNVHGRAGAGSQFFVFGEMGVARAHEVNITGSLFVNMGAGGDGFGPPDAVGSVGRPPAPATLNVGGDVTVLNSTVFVIAGSVGGELRVSSPDKAGFPGGFRPLGQLIVLGNFGRPFSLQGHASIKTGPGNDSISLENATLAKSLEISSGAGDDYVELANYDPDNGDGGIRDGPSPRARQRHTRSGCRQ